MNHRFSAFVAIDWSGAKGRKHKGIAIAEARGDRAPRLVRPGHAWSREEVVDWLLDRAAREPTLFGFDFSFAPPIAERGDYLPGEPNVPRNAREFWAYVDALSGDEDLGAASFLDRPPQAFLFRDRRRGEGRLHAFPRLRRAAQCAGRAQDCFGL